jgi:hypothetical protein
MKILIVIIILLILAALFYLVYAGMFYSPTVTVQEMGPYDIVYDDHIGPYQETGKIQDDIYQYLIDNYQISTFKGIGIYYDNPQKVAKEKLRSKAGCIIEQADLTAEIKTDTDYKFMTIDRQNMIYAEFPFKSKMSIMIGIMKVYPKMQKFCKEKEMEFRESIEIYDVPNKKILYLMKIDK